MRKNQRSRHVVADRRVPGLELYVSPKGEKYWHLRYRIHGEQRRLKIGRMERQEARKEARAALVKVDKGRDPRAEHEAARAATKRAKRDSIEALADAYIEGHAKKHKRTWRRDASELRCEVLPKWKGRAVTSITRRDCRELVRAIANRGAPTYAIAVARLLSKLFAFAVDEEWIETSPATRLIPKQNRDQDQERRNAYTPDEIRRIWANTENLPPCERAPIRLGLLTGQRPTEISDMQWPELEGSWWRIPGARTKNGRPHRVYLVPAALKELAEMWQVVDQPYVFAGRRGAKQLGQVNVQAFAGVRAREKPRHALRHTVGTQMSALGISRDHRGYVLNHVDSSVTSLYDEHSHDPEKRRALERWAERLKRIIESS